MRTIFNNTLVAENPNSAVTFVDNHDTEPGQALQSWIDDWFKPLAYSLILLRKGGIRIENYLNVSRFFFSGGSGCGSCLSLG